MNSKTDIKNDKNWKARRIWRNTFLSVLVVLIMLGSYNAININQRRQVVQANIQSYGEHQLYNRIKKVIFVASIWDSLITSTNGEVENFSKVSEQIMKSYDSASLESIQLAPDGIVQYKWTDHEVEDLNLDLENNINLLTLAKRSRYSGLVSVSSPITFGEKETRMVVIDPIYIHDENNQKQFWGFSIVSVTIPDIFEGIGFDSLGNTADFTLSKISDDGTDQIYASSNGERIQNPVEYYMNLSNGTWKFSAQWKEGWITPFELLLEILLIVAVIFVSGMVSSLALAKKTLTQQSMHDSLTGLNNRFALRDRINTISSRSQEIGVLFLDLDYFKEINDGYGHDAGDEALRRFADAIKEVFGEESCYRYGGDEFLVFMNRMSDEEMRRQIRTLENKKLGFTFKGTPIPISFSAGYTHGRVKGFDEIRARMKRADDMLYVSKNNGKGRVTYDA